MTIDERALAKEMLSWTDGSKHIISTSTVDHTDELIKWIIDFPHKVGTIFVAANEEILYTMRIHRPELDIRRAPLMCDNEN